jgi:hypothetical protein
MYRYRSTDRLCPQKNDLLQEEGKEDHPNVKAGSVQKGW